MISRRPFLRAAFMTVCCCFFAPPQTSVAQGTSALKDFWERQKQWASERMDDAANEKNRCRQSYATSAGVQECEARHERSYRYYNERLLEAQRELDKL